MVLTTIRVQVATIICNGNARFPAEDWAWGCWDLGCRVLWAYSRLQQASSLNLGLQDHLMRWGVYSGFCESTSGVSLQTVRSHASHVSYSLDTLTHEPEALNPNGLNGPTPHALNPFYSLLELCKPPQASIRCQCRCFLGVFRTTLMLTALPAFLERALSDLKVSAPLKTVLRLRTRSVYEPQGVQGEHWPCLSTPPSTPQVLSTKPLNSQSSLNRNPKPSCRPVTNTPLISQSVLY